MSGSKFSRREKRRYTVITSIVLFLSFGLLIFLSSMYVVRLRSVFKNETEKYILEVNKSLSAQINERIKYSLDVLKGISGNLIDHPDFHSKNLFNVLRKASASYDFERIGVALPDGTYRTTDDAQINIAHREYFKRAMTGQPSVSDVLLSGISGEKVIVYAVPLYRGGKPAGVMSGIRSLDYYTQILETAGDTSRSFSVIIDAKGSYIAKSVRETDITLKSETVEGELSAAGLTQESARQWLIEMAQKGESGLSYLHLYGSEYLIAYHPLGFNNWYLITGTPAHSLFLQTSRFVTVTMAVSTGIVLCLMLLLSLLSFRELDSRIKLDRLAYYDPVTAGGNSHWFDIEARSLLTHSSPGMYALILIDIDKFKLINNEFGHIVGDQILRYVYNCILRLMTKDERAVRIGADNYCLLVKYTDEEKIRSKIEELSVSINEFNKDSEKKFLISLSAGVYRITDKSMSLLAVKDRAALALQSPHKIKAGFARIGFYSEVDQKMMIHEKEIENRMECALEQEEFEVYLQPKYSVATNEIAGAEALVRWNDPDNGLVVPSAFIPLFERNGFILELDMYVFTQVCRILRTWIDAGVKPVVVSVNMSRVYLSDTSFLSSFDAIRTRYNVPSEYIELELTETIVLENMNTLIQIIDEIHSRGYSCSLDDFGSGYSSLNVLKNVPVDVLKLDRGFFTTLEADLERGNMIVSSVIDLAKKLNIKTVSEGVENQSQVDFLRGACCDMIQGFVFSKPLTVPEFEKTAFGLVLSRRRKTVVQPT